MSVVLKQPELEQKLDRMGRDNPVRASKTRLVTAIVDAAVHAAETRGVSIGRIIEDLKPASASTPTKPRASRGPALKLAQPPAT